MITSASRLLYAIYRLMRAARHAILAAQWIMRATAGYEKHGVYALPLRTAQARLDNKNLKLEIGDPADYAADLVLVMTWNKGLRPIPMRYLQGLSFPIRMTR